MGVKISELPEKASAGSADLVAVVDVSASGGYVTKRTSVAGLILQAITDWWNGSTAKTKLDGIADGATANATDAQLRDRATHTGTQAIGTVSGLQTALDGKVSTSSVVVASGKTLTVNNTVTLTGSDGASVDLGAGGTVIYGTSTIDGGSY